MTRIDFAFGAPDRLRTACQVIYKHYLAGHELVVYSDDRPLLERFDLLLWAFEPTTFVPHVAADDALAGGTPVRLTSKPPCAQGVIEPQQPIWLFNLAQHCPPNTDQFERVLEVVSADDNDKLAARVRWRQYKDAGHIPHAHDLAERADS